MTSAAYEANTWPAGLGRTLRPTRSVSSTPSSRVRADTAADTDGCDTTSSSAAAVTEPVRTTARKLRSWVTVTAICLSAWVDPSVVVYVCARHSDDVGAIARRHREVGTLGACHEATLDDGGRWPGRSVTSSRAGRARWSTPTVAAR